MNSGYKLLLLIALMAFVPSLGILAQDPEPASTKLQAAYFKDHQGQESIVAKLLIKQERYGPLAGAEIQVFAVRDTSKVPLEKLVTDDQGEAIYFLKDEDKAISDSSGLLAFVVEYAGNATTESASKDIEVKGAELKVAFFQEDTSKFISVEAFESGGDITTAPIAEVEIGLFVKGTFSYLNIAKDVTGSDGKLTIPFPVTMPGDSVGVITIAAKIEDNDVYGNVESWGIINWAHPVPPPVEPKRGLGDTDAPLWMVYTLIVLLSAVWLHYAYVIFLIIKFKLAKDHA
jgi:hypothetical protein